MNLSNNLTKITTPKKPAIYSLFVADKLVYIASTQNLLRSISQHLYNDNRQKSNFDSFGYNLVKQDANPDLSSIVAELILQHQPAWNKEVPSNATWKSFDWFARKYFKGRVRELKLAFHKQGIEPDYVFKSTAYYNINFVLPIIQALKF